MFDEPDDLDLVVYCPCCMSCGESDCCDYYCNCCETKPESKEKRKVNCK